MTRNLTKIVFTFVFLAACTFAVYAQAKPDLTVSKIEITKDRSNLFLQKITVAVVNGCREANADTSYVLVTFKQNDKKVAEASEDNNWRTLFPDGAGTVLSQGQCSPKM